MPCLEWEINSSIFKKMKTKKQKKRLTGFNLGIIVFSVVFIVAGALKVQAGLSNNAAGWIWGGSEDPTIAGGMGVIDGNENGIGWISMNSANCDTNGDGQINSGDTPVGGCPTTGPVGDYGVTIPLTDGPVTGYAYSENMGAIDFSPSGTAPDGSAGGVQRSGNNLEGWARFVSIAQDSAAGNSGGWSGWIHMRGSNYGVSIDPVTGTLSGYASAGADELGYINFSGQNYSAHIAATPPPPPIAVVVPPAVPPVVIQPDITPSVQATPTDGIVKCGSTGQAMCNLCYLVKGLNDIVQYIMKIAIGVALLAIVIGGVMYVVSAGDPGMIQTAKTTMKNAVIGFIIILSAFVIINTTIQVIGGYPNLGIRIASWGQFECAAGHL